MAEKLSRIIQTFIFFDLETTGLIQRSSFPRITEMSLIAVSRDALCNATDGLPRVLHKLTLPIHPVRDIPHVVKNITELSNENLKDVKPFECETYNLLMSFIKRLVDPVCFVSHNGNAFDYPLILWELKRMNKDLDDNILSIDTLRFFKEFFCTKGDGREKKNSTKEKQQCKSPASADLEELFDDEWNEVLAEIKEVSVTTRSEINQPENSCNNTSIYLSKKLSNRVSNQAISDGNISHNELCKMMQEMNEKTPESQIIRSNKINGTCQKMINRTARRKLVFSKGQPKNFKLATVYEHMFNETPANSHSAEGDCLTMLRCANQLGDVFVQWSDRNAAPLINFKKSSD